MADWLILNKLFTLNVSCECSQNLALTLSMYVLNNKHLMTGHKGNSEFCFPETLFEVEALSFA